MSAVADSLAGHPLWNLQRARWLLVALHVPSAAIPAVTSTLNLTGQYQQRSPVVPILAALAIGLLQLRHSLAAAQGDRPRGWPGTGLALLFLVYMPIIWFTWDWMVMQYFVVASALMLLRGRRAAVVAAAPVVGTSVAIVVVAVLEHVPVTVAAFTLVYFVTVMVVGGVGLYGVARLVQVLQELQATRAELAELAVGRERLRVSRDLHDLLGQTLSAISLKGDLAARLLRRDPLAARAELQSLAEVARQALRGIRAVTRDQHAVSLRTEADGAAALLRAAGIDAQVDLDLPELPPPLETMLAWTVREGVTNVLRHSQARSCRITAGRRSGAVWLEILNDGVHTPGDDPGGAGRGLAGVHERVQALSGSWSTDRSHGRFRLLVELPEEAL